MSLNAWQKAHAKQVRCVTCGHNGETNPETVALCDCCPNHCKSCAQTIQYPVLDANGIEAYTTSKCKCCCNCEGFPCVCHRQECGNCGYTKIHCSCCSDCGDYPCTCHEDCDCDSCSNGGYVSSPWGRGSHGSTLTAPWAKDGLVVDARTQSENYNDRWHIDHSINPATAAADFYLTEVIKHGLPNPVTKAAVTLAAEPMAVGVGAWGRLVTGLVALSSDAAVVMHNDGQRVILVREMTTPEDIHGMKVADGILTTTGGTSSHAAVVARGWNKTCVVGASGIKLRYDQRNISEGDEITIDGSTGAVYKGRLTLASLTAQSKLSAFLAPGGVKDVDYNDESNILNCYTPSHRAITYATNGRSFQVTSDGICSEVAPKVDYHEDQRLLASIMERSGLLQGEDLDSILEEASITHEVLVAWYAENFRKAAHCAIGGELRHHRCIGGEVLNAANRTAAWTGWIDVIEKVGVDCALRTAEALFMEMGGSYGGSRWAASAEALRMFEAGELTPALWVDRVMTLTHNGGMLLDKIRWKGKNSKGYGISHMVDYVLPAHGEGNYKLLLKLASPRVVELWNRYWDAANRARVLNGQSAQPNLAGVVQPPRVMCCRCRSKPWIGHHQTCSLAQDGYITAANKFDLNKPNECGYVYIIDEESFGGYDWSKWTDGPYYYNADGQPNESEKQTRSKPVVEVEYEHPGYSAKADTVTITSTSTTISTPENDPHIELLLLEEALIEAKIQATKAAQALTESPNNPHLQVDLDDKYNQWTKAAKIYNTSKANYKKGGK